MTKEEFKKYVLAEAQKYLFSTEKGTPEVIKENAQVDITPDTSLSITPSDITKLAEEMKKINKTIDLRNPLISESDESLVETILNENAKEAGRTRVLDVDDINKKKHIPFQNEGEKDKWNRMLNYDIPTDEDRD